MNKLVRVASGLLIKSKQVLFVRSKGKQLFYCPGGKIEANETSEAAVRRELAEEISIKDVNLELYNIFVGPSPDDVNTTIEMTCYLMSTNDPITINNEIEAYKWFGVINIPETTIIGRDILLKLYMHSYIT